MNQSPTANQRPAKRRRWRKIKPWGLCVHTSGRGILKRARRDGMRPIDAALKWYRAYTRSGVHYVIGYDGTIYQMQPDNIRGAHAGLSALDRRRYLSGRWLDKVSSAALAMWRARWPGYKSPQHLFPGKAPNGCYVGVELIPLPAHLVREDGLWFSAQQHAAVRALALDLAERHRWPKGWMWTSRLVGHEDVGAHSRWNTEFTDMPWDPGAMRLMPRFSWQAVRRPR